VPFNDAMLCQQHVATGWGRKQGVCMQRRRALEQRWLSRSPDTMVLMLQLDAQAWAAEQCTAHKLV
jgi:hypothetical protein